MDVESVLAIVIGVVFGLAILAALFVPVGLLVRKEEKKQAEAEPSDDALQEPAGTRFVHAKVLQKKINHYYYKGLNLPKNESSFVLVFETEEGETEEYPVPEELFMQTEEGQEGTLVTINGMFFDFGEGQDISDETDGQPTTQTQNPGGEKMQEKE